MRSSLFLTLFERLLSLIHLRVGGLIHFLFCHCLVQVNNLTLIMHCFCSEGSKHLLLTRKCFCLDLSALHDQQHTLLGDIHTSLHLLLLFQDILLFLNSLFDGLDLLTLLLSHLFLFGKEHLLLRTALHQLIYLLLFASDRPHTFLFLFVQSDQSSLFLDFPTRSLGRPNIRFHTFLAF